MDYVFDEIEFKKVAVNSLLFTAFKCDHFEISEVLKILKIETLPIDIPLNNNLVFIRDLTNFIVKNNLEPHIDKQ